MEQPLLTLKPPPINPGVYQFKDAGGDIIYIGKAKNLRNRVKTYFSNIPKTDFKIWRLVQNIIDVDYILTDTELEALILESALIKKYKPKYNIKLRDDKDYQFIKIDYALPIAKIYTVRKRDEEQVYPVRSQPLQAAAAPKAKRTSHRARYFGPFTSGLNVRNTIRLIKRIFPYCQSKEIGTRPCFNYQLHRCPGICIGIISPEEYRKIIAQVELFLQGKNNEIKKLIKKQMKETSRKQLFEKAASLRDQLSALESLDEQQKVISIRHTNQDYISLYRHKTKAVINLFLVRGGKLLGKENMLMENVEGQSDGEILHAFLESYYLDATNLPKEIFLETEVADHDLFIKFLQRRLCALTGKKHKIKIVVPKKGTPKKLVTLGKENAKNYLEHQIVRFEKQAELIENGLTELKNILKASTLPHRIECYDISNISGTSSVGSMVVFKDGLPDKNHYRKFKIRTKRTPDDYAHMTEMLERRLGNDWPRADLWVMDGGQGQLNAAVQVLKKYKQNIPVIALGKSRSEPKEVRQEKIFLPHKETPLVLGEGHPALTILQRLRDEAHRFALTYHRDVRSRALFEK